MDRLGNINYNGNIDLNNRKVLYNKDGSISTEKSIGVSFDPGDNYSITIPTIIDGKEVTANEARQNFMNTGQHLGYSHRNPNENVNDFYNRVENYDNSIHNRQSEFYKNNGLGNIYKEQTK